MRPKPGIRTETPGATLDLADIKGQESAKRALEVAAAGGHNLLMIGPPGSGKSMLAARLPTILPTLTPAELLEVSMIASVAGVIKRRAHQQAAVPLAASFGINAGAGRRRASRAAGRSLARAQWRAVLDELPEFQPQALDALRQPLEPARLRSPAPTTASPIRRASCWWRR